MHGRRASSPVAMDALVALLLTAAGVAALLLEPTAPGANSWRPADGWAVALMVGMLLPLSLRRVWPFWCLVIPGLCALLAFNLGYAATVGVLAVWAATGSAALHTDRGTAIVVGAIGAVAVGGSVALSAPSGDSPLTVLGAVTAGVLPAMVGDALRRAREQARRLQLARSGEVERARTQERLRIARDVHDAVGHHLSAINLQAAAGRLAPGGAPAALDLIDELSRRALDETRQILGLLRGASPGVSGVIPTLADLETLVADARRDGVDVTATIDPGAVSAPSDVQAVAYRVAREALTNVRRHARPAVAHLNVCREGDRLRVEVRDRGRPARRTRAQASGHGIAGMQERAHLLGGILTAGPSADGGWAVDLVVPIGA